MCRDPLEAYPTQGLDVFFQERGEDLESDKAARMRFLDLIGSEGPLIPDIGVAKELHSMLDQPSDWEIICVSRETSVTATTLGFDLGWWGSPEYYSIIWDSAIAPTWHGPPEEEWADLSTALKKLNKQALFDSPAEATAFRDYYVQKPWAEHEDDLKFEPIRIEVATDASRDAS